MIPESLFGLKAFVIFSPLLLPGGLTHKAASKESEDCCNLPPLKSNNHEAVCLRAVTAARSENHPFLFQGMFVTPTVSDLQRT